MFQQTCPVAQCLVERVIRLDPKKVMMHRYCYYSLLGMLLSPQNNVVAFGQEPSMSLGENASALVDTHANLKLEKTTRSIIGIYVSTERRGSAEVLWSRGVQPSELFGNHLCRVVMTPVFDASRPTDLDYRLSLGASIDAVPDAPAKVGAPWVTGKVSANYRSILSVRKGEHFPDGFKVGLFGRTFTATSTTNDEEVQLLQPVSSDHSKKDCFFSFPIDLVQERDFDALFGVDRDVTIPVSGIQDLDGKRWVCRFEVVDDGVRVNYCTHMPGAFAERGSPISQAHLQLGDRHAIGSMSFVVSEIVVVNDQDPKMGWVNVSDLQLADMK